MAELIGVQDRLCYGASSPGTVEIEFQEGSSLGLDEEFIDTMGWQNGSRSRRAERVRQGVRQVNGHIITTPSPVELDTYLPLFLGAAKSGTTFALAETIPTFYLGLLRGTTMWNYTTNYVTRASISAAARGPMRLDMTVVGTDETQSGAYPSISLDETSGPYTLMDLALTVGGSSYACDAFELTIDNFVEVKFRSGSLTPVAFAATNRIVTVDIPLPLGATYSTVYGASLTGLAVVATFTNSANGSDILTITLPAVQAPRDPLPFSQRGILGLPWRGNARKTGSSLEVAITSAHS